VAKQSNQISGPPKTTPPPKARAKTGHHTSEEDLTQHLKSLVFLSRSATRLLDPISEEELFEYAARQLQSITERAIVIVNEYAPRNNQTVVRALAGPGEKVDKLASLLGRNAVGLNFTVPEDERRQMSKGSLSHIEGGIHALTFGQTPIHLCRHIERDLNVGDIYAMPFMLGEDLMGTVAIVTDKSEGLTNQGVIEAFINQVALALRRKRAEQDLRESEQKYRSLVENANDGIIIIQDGILRYANPKMASLDRSSIQRLIGSSITDHVHPEEVAIVTEMFRRRASGEPVPSSYETVLKRSDGTSAPSELNAALITYQGKPAILAIIRDISERKHIERQLRQSRDELELRVRERTAELEESRRRYRDLVELLPEMIYESDVNGRFTYANRRTLDTFGYTQEDLEKGITNLDVVVPTEHPTLFNNAAQILAGEVLEGQEYIGRRKDGTQFPIFIRAAAIEKDGRGVGFRGVVMDLSESKKAETEKLRLEEQLWQAQKMEAIGTLAGGIAHDFNNILAIIMGNAELACDRLDSNDPDPRQNLEQIIRASWRARDIVKQILTFSKNHKAERNPIQLTPLLKETHNLLRGTLASTIRMEVEILTESDTILADPSQIEQVLINLATNAAYAMKDDGTLTMTLSNVTIRQGDQIQDAQLTPGEHVKLSVRDTGAGMAESVRKRVFEPFYSTKQNGHGTGMGLAVVYGIVTSHNGAITVESKPGKGSTFFIFLPLVESRGADRSEQKSAMPHGNERILVVDDEPEVLLMMTRILKGLGYIVATAENGTTAWEIFSREPQNFDLILTDQTMPGMTGIQLAKRMLRKRKGLPIILITGYSEAVSADKAKEIGIKAFVMKPIARGEVAKTIRKVLDDSNEGRSS
jgi:PAS domain S-box-containing protein